MVPPVLSSPVLFSSYSCIIILNTLIIAWTISQIFIHYCLVPLILFLPLYLYVLVPSETGGNLKAGVSH